MSIKSDTKMKKGEDEALITFKQAHLLVSEMIKMLEDGRPSIEVMDKNLYAVACLVDVQGMLKCNRLEVCFKKAAATKNKAKSKKIREEMIQVIKM